MADTLLNLRVVVKGGSYRQKPNFPFTFRGGLRRSRQGDLKLTRLFIVLSAILFVTGMAKSETITLQFSGNVTQVPVDEVFGDINAGDAILGSFSYDTSAVDLIPLDSSTGSYIFSAPFGMNVSIGAHTFNTAGSLNIGILNSFVDQYSVLATNETGDLTFEILLQNNESVVFTDDHLPSSAPPLAGFDQRDFHFDGLFDGGEVQADGTLSTLAAQDAPEPGTLAEVLAGFFVLLALTRSRRSSQFIYQEKELRRCLRK
jgi:hypothetical protein